MNLTESVNDRRCGDEKAEEEKILQTGADGATRTGMGLICTARRFMFRRYSYMGLIGFFITITSAACYDTATSLCPNGLRCPAERVCVVEQNRCVEPDELDATLACIDRVPMSRCSYDDVLDGICREGRCMTVSCGNGDLDPGEVCDDGNTIPGDGCSSDCQLLCGNGQIDDGEVCDTVAPPDESCIDYRYDLGTLNCADNCQRVVTDQCQSFSWTPIDASTAWHFIDIWARGENDIYAVGVEAENLDELLSCALQSACGFIAHYDGSNWSELPLAYEVPPITGIWGTDAGELHAVGLLGHTYRYNGHTWDITRGDLDTHLLRVWGVDTDHIFAVGAQQRDAVEDRELVPVIMRWDGDTWQTMNIETSRYTNPLTYLAGIAGTSDEHLVAVGRDGVLFRYIDDEQGWRRIDTGGDDSPSLLSLAAAPDGDMIAVGDKGSARMYRNGVWRSLNTGTDSALLEVVHAGNNHWFASSEQGDLLRFDENDAGIWQAETTEVDNELLTIVSLGNHKLLAAGSYGTVLSRHGSDWSKVAVLEEDQGVTNIYADSLGCLYAAAGSDVHVSDAGRTQWKRIEGSDDRSKIDVIWGKRCGSEMYVNAEAGRVARFRDGKWQLFETPNGRQAWDIAALDMNTLIVVGEDNLVAKVDISKDSPRFYPMSPPKGEHREFRTVWASPDGRIYVGGKEGVFFSFDGSAWREEKTGTEANIRSIWSTADGYLVVASASGLFEFDGSREWQSASTTWLPRESRSIWGVARDAIFAGGSGGALAFYDGTSWAPVRSPVNANITAVWASDWPGELFIGTEDGEIYRTEQFAR